MLNTVVPKLTDVVTEDALRIFLQGFFKKTKLAASIHIEPGKRPIYNESDLNPVCKDKFQCDGPNGCLDRNIDRARLVLESHDKNALSELEECPYGFRQVVEVIEHRPTAKVVAVICYGGVMLKGADVQPNGADICAVQYMTTEEFEDGRRKFNNFASDLENYYNAHTNMMDYAENKTVITASKSISGELTGFLDSIARNLDDTFENILRMLNSWTGSELSAICILDQYKPIEDPSNDMLVVRQAVGIKELERKLERNFNLPEFLKLEDSFIGRAIIKRKPVYTDNLDSKEFAWGEAIKELGTSRALALPLVLPKANRLLGGLICFPNRDIWPAELAIFENFSRKVAVSIHLATGNELYRRSRAFSRSLRHISTLTGERFYMEMVKAITATLRASAASVFIVDRAAGKLKLVGTTDKSARAQKLLGTNVYNIGEGITGFVAAQTTNKPYGEVVYDLYGDKRRSDKFAEKEIPTKSGKHSIMLTQILAPDGEVLGVVRCVDVQRRPEAVFNCFNHFYLEGLKFWAGIFGIIYTMKENMRRNHEFNLTFVHELGSNLMGLQNSVELAKSFIDKQDRSFAHRKLDDALTIAEVMEQFLIDVKTGSLMAIKGSFNIEELNEEPCYLERELLMPMKNAFLDLALSERGIGIHYESLGVQLTIDKKRILQVFTNLIRNGIKYSYDPKEFRHKKRQLSDIEINAYLGEYERVYIDFKNEGIGIDEDEKEIIFQQYRKGRNSGSQSAGGLGLGLYICKAVMQRHEGDIFVKSCRNPTIFTIWFPAFRVIRPDRRR